MNPKTMKEVKFKGKSMWPFLAGYEVLFFEENKNDYEIGDLILYIERPSKELVVHRLMKSSPLITKGDSALSFDEPILKEDILGSIVGVLKNGRSYLWDKKKLPFKKSMVIFSGWTGRSKVIRYLGFLAMMVVSFWIYKSTEDHI